jgi:hypothetical protein
MDETKLKTVPQEGDSNELQTEEYPNDENVQPCEWILTKQARKGQPCNKKAFNDIYCTQHRAMADLKEATEGKKLDKKEEFPILPVPPPNPNAVQHPCPSREPKARPVKVSDISMIAMPDLLAILKIFSETAVGITEALKK